MCVRCSIPLQSDEVWLGNCKKLMEVTEDLPLGLYETPVPQARYMHVQIC